MTNEDIINQVLDTEGGEDALIIENFNSCYVGTTITKPVRVVYDYWKCLDLLVNIDGWDFDESVNYLDELAVVDLGENTPLYVKQL